MAMYPKGNFKTNAMKTTAFIFFFLVISVLTSPAQSAFQVVVKGKGHPILLFPGFGCTGEVWDDAVAELSKTHQCHIFTFAGFGNVAPIEGPWLAKIKEGIIAYVKEKKLKKPTLLGHSLGGTLSLWLASVEPDLFTKIIVVEKQKVLIDWMNKADRKTYVYGYIDMLNLDLREAIAKIKIPVIVLGAANPDKATVEKTYKAQYEKLPSIAFYYAENSAHFVMYDQPKWFLEKLNENVK